MATTPDPVSRFSGPASVEEFQTWFDADGRLVKESLMRQCLFEGKATPIKWYVCGHLPACILGNSPKILLLSLLL